MNTPTKEGKKRYPPNGVYKGDFLTMAKVVFGKFVHVDQGAQIHVKGCVDAKHVMQVIWIS